LVEEICPQLKTGGYWEFFKCEPHSNINGVSRTHKLVSAGIPQNVEELKV